MNENQEVMRNPLASELVEKLIAKFAIPAIISMVVNSIYNIVDQIFIGQGVGTLGNGATNIAFPVTIICVATALFLGIGGASNYNLRSGEGNQEQATHIAANALTLLVIGGTIIMTDVLLFLNVSGNRSSVYAEVCSVAAVGEVFKQRLELGNADGADVALKIVCVKGHIDDSDNLTV